MKFRVLLFALSIAFVSNAQSPTEFRTWTKIGYRVKPAKDFNLDFNALIRTSTGDNFNSFIAELEAEKEISDRLNYALEFRHYLIGDTFGLNQGIDQRSRLRLNIERRYDLPDGDLYIRYGLQHREVVTGGGSRKTDARVRVLYAFGIKDFKWDPDIYAEYLQTLNGDYDQRLRLGVDTGNDLFGGKFSVGYFYQRNLTLTGDHYHTLGVGFRL